jgi:hypothetical protein
MISSYVLFARRTTVDALCWLDELPRGGFARVLTWPIRRGSG